jgi:signal transduction histidine kinase
LGVTAHDYGFAVEPKDKQPTLERDQTDSSLRAERETTDEELAKTRGRAETRADDLLDRAREQADETLEAARAKADAKLEDAGASLETLATVKAEQAKEDVALNAERRTADFLLDGEREQRERALSSLLDVERGQTDKHLLLERALLDETLARIFAELAQAVRLRDDFIALASHELKTPLTPFALRLQSLAREAARQPESPFTHQVNNYIEMAQRQISRLSTLVAELLDVSRITSGALTIDLQSVDFGAVVRDVAGRYGSQAEKAGSVLEVSAPKLESRWDGLLLEQTVTSLLENAIKFGLGRPIRVRLQASSEKARLTVHDEGIGIAREDQSRIFGRFERGVSDGHYGGLGLGLYTCRTIVEAMGGTVSVQSELGHGSTFTVELPL